MQHRSWLWAGETGKVQIPGGQEAVQGCLVCLLPCSFNISRLHISVTQVPLATAQDSETRCLTLALLTDGDMPLTGHPQSPKAAAQCLICTAASSPISCWK